LDSRRFRISLSFTCHNRDFVNDVALVLSTKLGQERILFDEYYQEEFARVALGTYLPALYEKQSDLIVLFLCENYKERKWCRLEWKAIQKVIEARPEAVMLVRFDETELEGWCEDELSSGYLDIRDRSPAEIARRILKRAGESTP
jgi:hypothetical protein